MSDRVLRKKAAINYSNSKAKPIMSNLVKHEDLLVKLADE